MNKNELPEKNVTFPCEKGQSKEHFQPLIPTGKTYNTAQLPQPISWSHREHSDFSPCPRNAKYQLSCFSRVMHSTPKPSPNDTQPLSLNLEKKPVHTQPVVKEIPKEMLLHSCPWSTVAILSCEAPAGARGSFRSLPNQTILFSSVSAKQGDPYTQWKFLCH